MVATFPTGGGGGGGGGGLLIGSIKGFSQASSVFLYTTSLLTHPREL